MTLEKLSEETKEARQKLIANGADENAVDAYIALGIGDDDLSEFEEAYQGQYQSDVEFAQEMAEELGEIPKDNRWPHYCIDWEWAGRELMMDYSEQDGYYFRNL